MLKKILLWSLLLWTPVLLAGTSADELQKRLNAIKTMQASFKQVVSAKKQDTANSSGSMALSRPNHFRWQTKKPMPQLLIADGKKLWMYDEELEQVSVRKQSKNIGGAAAIFLGDDNNIVQRDFYVTMKKNNKKDYYDLRARGSKASFERVKLVFDGEMLKIIELYDQLGQHTKVYLEKVKINSKLSPSLFAFIVPKGTDVVSQ
ncbi:MAG: outer membrane lipoprotein chaperone LolA [Legionellaceae bacterium]|nr:outer membrane lipoprotein chaperone LolA [Legionellaceae bacterium]